MNTPRRGVTLGERQVSEPYRSVLSAHALMWIKQTRHPIRFEEAVGDRNGDVARVGIRLFVEVAPNQILAALRLEFADALRVPEVEATVVEIERRMRAEHPEVVTLFIKPQTEKA